MSNVMTDDDWERVEIDHSPVKTSAIGATIAAIVATVTSAPFALLALPLGIGGISGIVVGLWFGGNRSWVTVGTGSLFLSILISASFGAPVEPLLISMVATIVAWDVGQNAISLGDQMGRHSRTQRNEVIHAATTTIVAFVAAGISYLVYLFAGNGQPVAALGMMAIGLVFLIWAIRT